MREEKGKHRQLGSKLHHSIEIAFRLNGGYNLGLEYTKIQD